MILKHATTWHNIAVYVNDSGDAFSLTNKLGLKLKALRSDALGRHVRKYRTRTYYQINLCTTVNGINTHKNCWLHILVCMAFHGPRPSPIHQVDHIDHDRWNNTPSNLRWVTPRENQMNGALHLRKIERLEREKRALLSARPVQLTINF